ncbi:LCP family protein [Microlunatus ginsengisoli]|uniref:LCP family protein n=1 Tax=Microlunatus ginsengisoli TaxID=363863 RepID=A0ABP6ZIG5_9ACTN
MSPPIRMAPPASTEPDPRGRKTSRRRSVLLIALIGTAVLIVGALVFASVYVVRIDSAVEQNLQRVDEMPPDSPTDPSESPRPAKNPASKAINYVLIGSDSRAVGNAGAGRSDALMVLHLTGDRREAYLISFPRDLYVPIPGHGKDKINAAYAYGGTALTIRTLEGLLDTRMDHVAVIDFAGFIGLTDDLGGVTVYNQYPSRSDGYAFPQGNVTIRGQQALAYVRERKQLPHGDLDRAERQRAVVAAIMKKGLSPAVIADPDRFVRFAGGAARHISVDRQLTDRELRKTAASLRLTPDDVFALQAPITGFGTSPTKQSIDIVDQPKLDVLAAALRDDRMTDYVASYPN